MLQERDPDEDEDLLFLFLAEDQVFLKLTRTCNNICSFCCDTVFWNGTHMDPERVRAKMEEGAQKRLKRLFFSGGEPTIHPDFIRFVKYGRELGYEQIITITNGRMFFYDEFARKSVRAGLSEVIFSLNSHDAKTHDALVGVKGAFDQVVRGVENVRALGTPFRMNVVVTLKNYSQLPDMVRAFAAMGARSTTFLQLVPNDRDWERSRHSIYYETELGRPYVRGALEAARELGFGVEFKKFPENFFEDHEDHIVDPMGWALELGEIDWRRPDRHAPYKAGGAVKCWGERCAFCAYRPFCSHLMDHQARRKQGQLDGFTLDGVGSDALAEALARQPQAPATLSASDAAEASARMATLGPRPVAVRLASFADAATLPIATELIVTSAAELDRVAELAHPVRVELNRDTVAWLGAHRDWITARGPHLTVAPQLFLRLETARSGQVDLAEVFRTLPLAAATVRGIPACLTGRSEPAPTPYEPGEELLAPIEDVPAHARHHYWRGFYTKSARCRACRHDPGCAGVHINYARQFGYRSLAPVAGERDISHQ